MIDVAVKFVTSRGTIIMRIVNFAP